MGRHETSSDNSSMNRGDLAQLGNEAASTNLVRAEGPAHMRLGKDSHAAPTLTSAETVSTTGVGSEGMLSTLPSSLASTVSKAEEKDSTSNHTVKRFNENGVEEVTMETTGVWVEFTDAGKWRGRSEESFRGFARSFFLNAGVCCRRLMGHRVAVPRPSWWRRGMGEGTHGEVLERQAEVRTFVSVSLSPSSFALNGVCCNFEDRGPRLSHSLRG